MPQAMHRSNCYGPGLGRLGATAQTTVIPAPAASEKHLGLTGQALPVQGAADSSAFHMVKS
jgi:hypothetical protein